MERCRGAVLSALVFGLMLRPALNAQSLAEAARDTKRASQSQPTSRVFTNDDLTAYATPSDREMVRWTSPPSPTAATMPAAATPSEDESHWRQRTAALVTARDKAREAVDELESRLKSTWNQYYAADDPAYRGKLRSDIDEQTKKLDEARRRLEQAAKELADLSEEGRKAGALPGWLR